MQQTPAQLPGFVSGGGAPRPPSIGNALLRVVVGLVAIALLIVLVIVLVPVILTAVLIFLGLAMLLALFVILRAKVRKAMGLPPKPMLGAKARAMRDYRAQRAAGVPPFDEGDRENVRVRTHAVRSQPRSAPSTDGRAAEASPREVIDGEATRSREVG